MSKFINGTYKVLELNVPTVGFVPIGCLTENSFTERVEMLETTTRENTGGWITAVPLAQGYTIDFSGLVPFDFYDTEVTYVSLELLKTYKRARTKISWRIVSNGSTESGEAYITEIGDSAVVDEFVSFTGSLLGYGEITITESINNYEFQDLDNFSFNDLENFDFNINT